MQEFRQTHRDRSLLYDERENTRVYRDPDGVLNMYADPSYQAVFEPDSRGLSLNRGAGLEHFAKAYPDKARAYVTRYPDLKPFIKDKAVSESIRNVMPDTPQAGAEVSVESTPVVQIRKKIFVKPYPNSTQERVKLSDEYGLPQPGPEGKGYVFHGTNAELIPEVIENGLFARPDQPTVSTVITGEVHNAAQYRHSKLHKGVVVVWQVPNNQVEFPKGSYLESIGVPKNSYIGSREDLQIPESLKENEDLRQLSPDGIIGIYIVDQNAQVGQNSST